MFAALLLASVTAHPGTTYSQVAFDYGVSVAAVEADNPYPARDIPIGATINVPRSYRSGNDYGYRHRSTVVSYSSVISGGSFQSCVIQRESGGNPAAVNASSGAGGEYQFLPSTWQALGFSGLPQDASLAEQTAAFDKAIAEGHSSWWSNYDGC